MAVKKSELYSSLWKSCDELRGGMDASQYKDYVLVLLFVKYVSDKAASQKNYLLEVPKGGSFADMVALKGDKEIGDKMNKIIAKLAGKNDLKGVIDVADWNDADKLGKGKEMVDRLSNLVAIFDKPELDFRGNRAEGDDLLGDAYEYLMRHFATESGKSKGQFYTPAEVSRIMAKVIGVGGAKSAGQTIHDPTCGSGSLLLKAHDEAKGATGLDLAVYGQEMDNATRALASMNLILHDCPTGEVWQDNTLSSPHFHDAKTGALKTFDFVVANPPFSTKAWTNGFDPANDRYGRFALGVPPPKNGDYAFLLHILACLKSTGKGAVILPHGVLFRGGSEAGIRREIVKRGFIKGIIGLPANLFYGTGIPACIVVLDKEGAAARKGIFMIDASKGFIKDGNKNRLRAQDIHKIVDVFTRQLELPRYSRMVPLAEIGEPKNAFNLNLPRYIDSSEPEDIQDIDGHLRGGIPDRDLDALERYWKVFPGMREALFKQARPGYAQLKIAAADIKSTIFGHTEFTAWSTQTKKLFAKWRTASATQLRAIAKGDKPKALIDTLSEELLSAFQKAKLLDPYDVYQHLMDYWADTMQDDVYLIASDGWREAAKPRLIVEEKDKKTKDKPDFTIGKQKFKAELIPPTLLVARYFAAEQATIEELESEAAAVTQAIEELAEEHCGEDGLLAEAKNDRDKLTKASVSARLKEITSDCDAADERRILNEYLAFVERDSAIAAKLKAAQEGLITKFIAKYGKLTEDDIKTLVINDKWLARLELTVQSEVDRVSFALTGRVFELTARYATPLKILTDELSVISARVQGHIERISALKRSGDSAAEWRSGHLRDVIAALDAGVSVNSIDNRTDGVAHDKGILKTSAVASGKFIARENKRIAARDLGRARLNPRSGSILISRMNTPDLVGECGYVDRDYPNLFVPDRLWLTRFHQNVETSGKWLSYLLSTPPFKRIIGATATGTSGSMKNLSKRAFLALPLLLPPGTEQNAIGEVLSDMDSEIAANERVLDKIRLIRQGMMQELLTGRTRLL